MGEFCEMEIKNDMIVMECDLDNLGTAIVDKDACTSASGSIVKTDVMTECADLFSTTLLNMPYCLHTTCDAQAFADSMGDAAEMEMDDLLDCEYEVKLSGATFMGSTSSMFGIALGSLFAMLW